MLIMDLSPRPLLDIDIDQRLYLTRPVHGQIERLIKRHNNVLIYGERGIGKTTLLRALAYTLRAAGVEVFFIESRLAGTPLELIDLIRTRLTPTAPAKFADAFKGPSHFFNQTYTARQWQTKDDTSKLLEQLRGIGEDLTEHSRLLDDLERLEAIDGDRRRLRERPVVILDEVASSDIARELFARFRDELWKLNITWLIASSKSELDGFLTPPGDVFFAKVIELSPLRRDEQIELINLRINADSEITNPVPITVEDNPRRLLVATAEIIDSLDNPPPEQTHERVEILLQTLGEPAIELSRQLEVLGPTSASDPELQTRLGWSRSRVVQVLKQLEAYGLVKSFTRSDGPGAPRKLYRLEDPGFDMETMLAGGRHPERRVETSELP